MINLNALPLAGDRASLLEVLGGLTDPRARRGIRHQVAATLTMVTAAGLSGCGRSFRSAADFIADLPQEALARLGARDHPVKRRHIAPEESTIRRHVKMIDADQADRQDTTEVTQILPLLDDIAAARQAASAGSGGGQSDKGDLDGVVITAGALQVHRENLQQVTDRGGECMTVKGNMPSLERDIAALLPESPAGGGALPPHHVTVDRGHGRNEIRTIWCSSDVAGLDFPCVYQSFRTHRQIYDLNWNPLRKPETVHPITSLTAWQANPADILATARNIVMSLLRARPHRLPAGFPKRAAPGMLALTETEFAQSAAG